MDKLRGQALACGALAGLVNGLFGGGGGAVLLPLLARLGLDTRQGLATCVGIIAPVCAVSAALYWQRGALVWELAWPYLLGGFLGGLVAGRTLKRVKPALLRRVFALLLIWGGVRQWL